jgi:hypothetical protein
MSDHDTLFKMFLAHHSLQHEERTNTAKDAEIYEARATKIREAGRFVISSQDVLYSLATIRDVLSKSAVQEHAPIECASREEYKSLAIRRLHMLGMEVAARERAKMPKKPAI